MVVIVIVLVVSDNECASGSGNDDNGASGGCDVVLMELHDIGRGIGMVPLH
jgi:hypothetical protein